MTQFASILKVLKVQRLNVLMVIGLFVVMSVTDVVGVGLLAPYIALLLDASLQDRIVALTGMDALARLSYKEMVLLATCVLACIFCLRTIVAVVAFNATIKFAESERLRVKAILVDKLRRFDALSMQSRNEAEYVHLIQIISGYFASNVLFYFLKLLADVLVIASIFLLLGFTNIYILAALVLLVGTVGLGYDTVIKRRLETLGRIRNQSDAAALQAAQEMMRGIFDILAYGKFGQFERRFTEHAHQVGLATRKAIVLSTLPRYLLELIVFLFFLGVAGTSVLVMDDFTAILPTLAVFAAGAMRVLPAATSITSAVSIIRANAHSIQRLEAEGVMESKLPMVDIQQLRRDGDEAEAASADTGWSFEQLELKDVTFAYAAGEAPVLSGASLAIKQGDVIGISGKSGTGKSTTINLLLGFLTPNSGTVTINGLDLERIGPQWLNRVAVIPQTPFLFEGSLAQNVAMELDPDRIDRELLDYALDAARLGELVASHRGGVDMPVGEKGDELSGGQRQRVAIARALYFGSEFVVLDEPTSAIDSQTAGAILDTVIAMRKDKTIVLVSHDAEMLAKCETLVHLSNGQITKTKFGHVTDR